MEKLANIGMFEGLQSQANRQAQSQMSVFNGAGIPIPDDVSSGVISIYRAIDDALGKLMDYILDGSSGHGQLSGADYEALGAILYSLEDESKGLISQLDEWHDAVAEEDEEEWEE